MSNTSTESWDNYTGTNFLKPSHVTSENDPFVVIGIEIVKEDDNPAKPRVTFEKAGEKYIYDLNVSNSNFCKNAGVKTPKDLIGKKVFFKKVLVNSPVTKKEVESLRIFKIE